MTTFVRRQLIPAVALLLVLTLITGFAYPLVVTVVAQVAFPHQAEGSLLVVDGKAIGSTLIGQSFAEPRYFSGRLSAAGSDGYDANASAGSNLGPTNQALIDRISKDVDALRAANGDAPIPVGADYQVARVAKARGMAEADVRAAVTRHTEGPLLGFLGQTRVHVLELNLDLDGALR